MESLPSIQTAHQQFRAGELTPIDLVEHCLGRIGEFDPSIRAWVLVDESGARREAQRLTEMAARGEFIGPLHGIPIGVKDIIDVAGLPTKCGSPLLEDAPPAETDATVVANLRNAGAIILGKTVTTEWACFDPPPTRNPWNFDHTPGGSSSGSAAAMAMEMCMAALGTQTGGSIIRPAAYCGVCGLKPTYQPELLHGIAPVSFHLDHVGPLARSAADLWAVYAGMSLGKYAAGATTETKADQPPMLCRLRAPCCEQVSAGVNAAVEETWQKLKGLTQTSEKAELPFSFSEMKENHFRIMAVEAAEVHRNQFLAHGDGFGPEISNLIRAGLDADLMDYVRALKHQHRCRTNVLACFSRGPLLVMPATPAIAPSPETTGDARLNALWSYCGAPSATIPCGTDGGLPVGLQIISPYHTEAELLAAAAWLEVQIGFHERPGERGA